MEKIIDRSWNGGSGIHAPRSNLFDLRGGAARTDAKEWMDAVRGS